MNNNHETITSAQKQVRLPEPNADNITVLAHSLPNTPILPWNRFDSRSRNNTIDERKEKFSLIAHLAKLFVFFACLLDKEAVSISVKPSQPTEREKQNQDYSKVVDKK